MGKRLFFILAVMLFAMAGVSIAGNVPTFQPYAGNPVIESTTIPAQKVKNIDEEYRLYVIEQRTTENYPADFFVDLMTSVDGIHWDWKKRQLVSAGTTFNYYIGEVKVDGKYHAFHTGTNDACIAWNKLYHSTSEDGVNYTIASGSPIFNLEDSPGYDSHKITTLDIIHVDETYHLFYRSHAWGPSVVRCGSSTFLDPTIAYATSADGVNWIKHGSVIIGDDPIGFDFEGYTYLGTPSVLYEDGQFEMFFSASNRTDSRCYYATSGNGYDWEVQGIVKDNDGNPIKGIIGAEKKDGKYTIWSNGRSGTNSLIYHTNVYYSIGSLPLISGQIVGKDAQGNVLGPLSGATIQLSGGGSTTTDIQGTFRFNNITPGTYTAVASAPGYYSDTRQIAIGPGDSKNETFYLVAQQAETPSAYNFKSPDGRHFIEGMPGDLSFETIVAWNGSPGTVRFMVGDQWITAETTDLGSGLAKATLTIAAPAIIGSCFEMTIEVANGNGEKTYVNTGVYFYPTPGLVSAWYEDNIPWTPSGLAFTYSSEEQLPSFLIPNGINIGPFSIDGYFRKKKKLRFDPLAGSFGGEIVGSLGAKFKTGTPLSNIRFYGEAQGNVGAGLDISLAGCNLPQMKPYWDLGFSGKAGVGVPTVAFVQPIIPPAAVAINLLLAVPVVCDVVGSLETRFYIVFGLDFKGSYGTFPDFELGDNWLWAKDVKGTGTLGLEIRSVLELYGAYVGLYGGGTVSVPAELPLQISKVRGYAGVYAGYKLFRYKKEYGVEFLFEEGEKETLRFIESDSMGSIKWEPIGSSLSEWGDANRPSVVGRAAQHLSAEALGETGVDGTREFSVVENVTVVATPSLIADANETSVAFTLHDTEKPWYAATDIAEARTEDGQTWSISLVIDDLDAEFSPQITGVNETAVLAACTHLFGDVSGAQSPVEIAPYQEIVASWQDRDTKVWEPSLRITNNSMVDRNPHPVISGSNPGIVWIQNEGDLELGNSEKGDSLLFIPWTGSQWGIPQTLWAAKKGILDFSFVRDAQDKAHIVFVVDEDGDSETKEDQELYWISAAGNIWQAAQRLTNDEFEDAIPALIAPNGTAICVWCKSGTLQYATLDQWLPKPVFVIETGTSKANSLSAVTLPAGAAIGYASSEPEGTDIFAAFYDAGLDQWSLPRQLTHDEHAESSLSMGFDGQELVVAYLKTQTLRDDIEVEIDGQLEVIENVPQPGRTDLYVLRHILGNDLAVSAESLVLEPSNPLPGTLATIKAIVQSKGDLPVQNIAVVFYDGDPNEDGTLIGEAVIEGPLAGGEETEVTVSWDIPAELAVHQIVVVVDPALTVEDRDRANNTASVQSCLPDMMVETAWSDPISADTLALTARVTNQGAVAGENFDVSWQLNGVDGVEIGKTTVESINPGSSHEVVLLWTVDAPVQPGQFMPVSIVVDPGEAVLEMDESNNTGLQSVKTPMYTDQVGTLTVNIMPPEAVAAGVKWSPDAGANWYASGTGVTLLAGFYSITFSQIGDWAFPAIHNVEVMTDQGTVMVGQEPLVGDVNIDGTVDLADAIAALQIVSDGYAQPFTLGCDVNNDQKIGLEEGIYSLQTISDLRK